MATITAPTELGASSDTTEQVGIIGRAFSAFSARMTATCERIVERERLRELNGLDEFMLRDIGASGDEIYRLRQQRNGERPTLTVG